MNKLVSFFASYVLVPLLILLYAQTGHWVFEWTLGILVVCFFLLMLLFSSFAWHATNLKELDSRVAGEAAKLERKGLSILLHFIFGVIVAVAIFVYVNTFIGLVYCCTLVLLQVMRLRIKRAAFK